MPCSPFQWPKQILCIGYLPSDLSKSSVKIIELTFPLPLPLHLSRLEIAYKLTVYVDCFNSPWIDVHRPTINVQEQMHRLPPIVSSCGTRMMATTTLLSLMLWCQLFEARIKGQEHDGRGRETVTVSWLWRTPVNEMHVPRKGMYRRWCLAESSRSLLRVSRT